MLPKNSGHCWKQAQWLLPQVGWWVALRAKERALKCEKLSWLFRCVGRLTGASYKSRLDPTASSSYMRSPSKKIGSNYVLFQQNLFPFSPSLLLEKNMQHVECVRGNVNCPWGHCFIFKRGFLSGSRGCFFHFVVWPAHMGTAWHQRVWYLNAYMSKSAPG